MNFLGESPHKDIYAEASAVEVGRVFEYPAQKDAEFFESTDEREFDKYMQQHDDSMLNPTIEQSHLPSSEVNPSANPASSVMESESQFSR